MRIAVVVVVCLSVAAFVNAKACKKHVDCGAKEYCDKKEVCQKKPYPCKTNDDCKKGPKRVKGYNCNSVNQCVPIACRGDADCKGNDQVCKNKGRLNSHCISKDLDQEASGGCSSNADCQNGACLDGGVCGCRIEHPTDCQDNEACWTSLAERPNGFCRPTINAICGVENSQGTTNGYGWNSDGSWDNDTLHTMDPYQPGCGQCNDWSNYGSVLNDVDNWICLDENCETAHNKFCNNDCKSDDATKCGKCGWDHNERRCVEEGRENQVGEFCANFPGHDNC